MEFDELRNFRIIDVDPAGKYGDVVKPALDLLNNYKVEARAVYNLLEALSRAEGHHAALQKDKKALQDQLAVANKTIDQLKKEKAAVDQQLAKKTNESSEQKPPAGTGHVSRTALQLYWSANEMYFFEGPKYVRLDAVDKTQFNAPHVINDMWPGLKVFANGVDAILPTDKNEKTAWFFSGDSCILLDVGTGNPAFGSTVSPWATQFPDLKAQGFKSIDCIVPHFWKGGNPNYYSFFSGTKEVVLDLKENRTGNTTNSSLLSMMGFTKADAFVFVPGTNFEEGYFFSGSKYVRVLHLPDKVLSVPDNVLGFAYTQKDWLGLEKAGFFG